MKWNRLIFQDKKSYFKALFIGVLNSIFMVLGTWLFYKALENLNASQLSMSLYFLLGFIGCEIFSIFFEYYKQKLFIWLIYSTQNNLRYAFFNKLNKIHPRDFKNQANESFLNLLETDSNNVAQYALVQVTILSYITVVIGYTILYAYLAWMIILIFWAISIVKFLIQLIVIKFKAKNTVRAKALQENLFVKIGNYANNFLSFVFADKTKLIVRLFIKNINGIYIKEAKYDAISSTFGFIQNLLNWIALATCFVTGLLMYQNQIISLSLFIIFVTYFNRFDSNFRALFDVFEDVKLIKEYNKKVNDFFARFQTKNLLNKVEFEKLSELV
ncbi:hypothetical protein C4M97_03380 [Mycoplasmopsis pullorum]|uniref:ABC transporter transmembrane domain-containing protein n=1 Tax=Mycoplasmopsis pullorum TaxID=48003 RepID=UPI0011193691|nr:ABC transporter transmembrane domain-containing protein [Mycoplasmopsis pullorum]TNK81662.1 hypothetical protein C4M94_03425 [Mycoplasmopsis pullorum]TNK82946.1 hypothetical protein C4M80_01895 [Mycoplasmopsis pullorum]TNK84311.1 hypothetical protein C4M81_02705 [Mycoplasmopsis pullorum]TNK84499.1 hypothetical protein C4M92_03360 [Mycoplasmopsis pullorum]TNK85985.1 hypothetical protein C4M85_01745 [Mycoplasmopsis pullorum]